MRITVKGVLLLIVVELLVLRAEARAPRLPQQIKVGDEIYRVELRRVAVYCQGQVVEGCTDCGKNTIEISAQADDVGEVFAHEIAHALSGCNDENWPHGSIYDMAGPLRDFIRDNPRALKYLRKTKAKP